MKSLHTYCPTFRQTCRTTGQCFLPKPYTILMLVASFALCMISCAPMRAAVPMGSIPAARPISVEDEQYGHKVLSELNKKYPLDYQDPRFDTIQKVVDKLTKAAGADKNPWHVYLFKAPEIKNAAATRGNHIFVWSGMLDIAQREDEIAAIISHEIAHLLSGHTDPDPNEEITKILLQVGAIAAGTAVSAASGGSWGSSLGNLTSSVTNQVGQGMFVYPYSREMELEADRVGLMLYAAAKYNPERSIEFWERLAKDPSFQSGPEFLSTHPATESRIEGMKRIMPLAMDKYSGKNTSALQNSSGIPFLERGTVTRNPLPAPIRPSYRPNERPTAGSMLDSKDTTYGSTPSRFLPSDPMNPSSRRSANNFSDTPAVPTWRITTNKLPVYSQPDRGSVMRGQLPINASVVVIRTAQGWLQITAPINGYIQETYAEPLR